MRTDSSSETVIFEKNKEPDALLPSSGVLLRDAVLTGRFDWQKQTVLLRQKDLLITDNLML